MKPNYKISRLPPPIYPEAVKKFSVNFFRDGIVFTYGDTIHICDPTKLTPDLIAHEGTHIKQQRDFPGGAEAWWRKYFDDPKFRLIEEIVAYRVQYQYVKLHYKNSYHEPKLEFFAKSLVKLYALKMDLDQARELISNDQ